MEAAGPLGFRSTSVGADGLDPRTYLSPLGSAERTDGGEGIAMEALCAGMSEVKESLTCLADARLYFPWGKQFPV